MKGRPIQYDAEELAWIEARADWPRRKLHETFCRLWRRSDVSLAALNSLCKRKGWLTGRTGGFKKGQEPHNKGKPFAGGKHPNARRTQFQPGQLPHNARGPGHESIDPKDGYVWLIVAERNPYTGAATRRVQKHQWLWEQANGPVPAGHVLKCLDADKTNTDPSNWLAVPRALLPRLSGGRWHRSYDDAPPEIRPTLLAIAQLEHAAREARKRKHDHD